MDGGWDSQKGKLEFETLNQKFRRKFNEFVFVKIRENSRICLYTQFRLGSQTQENQILIKTYSHIFTRILWQPMGLWIHQESHLHVDIEGHSLFSQECLRVTHGRSEDEHWCCYRRD